MLTDDAPTPPSYDWGSPEEQESFAVVTAAHQALNRTRHRLAIEAKERGQEAKELEREIQRLTCEGQRLRKDDQQLRREGERLRQELVRTAEKATTSQRALQRQIDEIRSRQRPPGAAIRDGVRRRLVVGAVAGSRPR